MKPTGSRPTAITVTLRAVLTQPIPKTTARPPRAKSDPANRRTFGSSSKTSGVALPLGATDRAILIGLILAHPDLTHIQIADRFAVRARRVIGERTVGDYARRVRSELISAHLVSDADGDRFDDDHEYLSPNDWPSWTDSISVSIPLDVEGSMEFGPHAAPIGGVR